MSIPPRIVLPVILFFCLWANKADAATMTLVSEKKNVTIGEEFAVTVRIDTEGESSNAGQGVVEFPSDLLEVIHIDKSASAFNFWLEEPNVSNDGGTVRFIGGTPKGVSGSSLQVLRLTVRARANGSAELFLSNAAITASDGKGTNILSHIGGTVISIGPGTTVLPDTGIQPLTPSSTPSPAPSPSSTLAPVPAPAPAPQPKPPQQPRPVLRRAVPATRIAEMPVVKVPLYPDSSQWYSHDGDVIVLWDVPDDLTHVATTLDRSPITIPTVAEDVLLNGKKFGKIEEGIWYVHTRFKNSRDWGPTVHYKISLDTTPPIAFETMIDSFVSDNPSPLVTFSAFDALSGISEAVLFIDGKEVLRAVTTTTVLPPQAAGMHTLLVRVADNAGNSVEDDLTYEILPLPTPTIDFVSRTLAYDETLFVSGKASANVTIVLQVLNAAQLEVFRGTAKADNSGNWEITADEAFPSGEYTLAVIAQDDREAISYPSKEEKFRVRPKTVISFGGLIDLGWFEIFILVTFIGATGTSLAAWHVVRRQKTSAAYRVIASRDVEKFAEMLLSDIEEVDRIIKGHGRGLTSKTATELKPHSERLRLTVEKMKKYLGDEIRKGK